MHLIISCFIAVFIIIILKHSKNPLHSSTILSVCSSFLSNSNVCKKSCFLLIFSFRSTYPFGSIKSLYFLISSTWFCLSTSNLFSNCLTLNIFSLLGSLEFLSSYSFFSNSWLFIILSISSIFFVISFFFFVNSSRYFALFSSLSNSTFVSFIISFHFSSSNLSFFEVSSIEILQKIFIIFSALFSP